MAQKITIDWLIGLNFVVLLYKQCHVKFLILMLIKCCSSNMKLFLVKLNLHDWDIDFATWCSYKYLNSGPGGTSGVFVHEKHANNNSLPRLSGWWGNDEAIRFKMEKGFVPKANASGWNISTAQVLNMVGLKASLEIFDATTMEKLRSNSRTPRHICLSTDELGRNQRAVCQS